MGKTRIIHLHEGADRSAASNIGTTVRVFDGAAAAIPPPAKPLLARVWREARAVIASLGSPGVAVVVIDTMTASIAASLCVAARPRAISSAIIGRHSRCDLYLARDGSLSLRHIALLVEPQTSWERPHGRGPGWDVDYRLLDLRTSTGFREEGGRQLEAATIEGPAFVYVGRYLLGCFPTGGEDAWPEDAGRALDLLPERLYTDARGAEPDRWRRGPHASRRSPASAAHGFGGITRVTGIDGPSRARLGELRADDELLGVLELESEHGRDRVLVGSASAARGILLGRYERCDGAGTPGLAIDRISRVHLLVWRHDDRLWAIDTASTHGVLVDGEPTRVRELQPGDALSLADDACTVTWRPVH